MCGIAGYITSRRSIDVSEVTRLMTHVMERRGPDSQGLEQWPGAALGHRRLAILDLSPAGSQPIISEDGKTGVVFNGCIYNFQDLRRELEDCGEKFQSNCDTDGRISRARVRWRQTVRLPRNTQAAASHDP
jgi:asparagine synthase (glutamine-hydrolysing)